MPEKSEDHSPPEPDSESDRGGSKKPPRIALAYAGGGAGFGGHLPGDADGMPDDFIQQVNINPQKRAAKKLVIKNSIS